MSEGPSLRPSVLVSATGGWEMTFSQQRGEKAGRPPRFFPLPLLADVQNLLGEVGMWKPPSPSHQR